MRLESAVKLVKDGAELVFVRLTVGCADICIGSLLVIDKPYFQMPGLASGLAS